MMQVRGRPTRQLVGRQQSIRKARAGGNVARRATLPEYLEPPEINTLMQSAPHAQARLLFLVQWRAGLRVSEALALEVADLQLDGERPSLKVRQGKGNRDRVVPVHPELAAGLRNFLAFSNVRRGKIFDASRSTAWRWLKQSLAKAEQLGMVPPGRRVGTHTLRHSAARHWWGSGVPINVVSRWLGHASLQTTLVYLEILPDPSGYMDRVP